MRSPTISRRSGAVAAEAPAAGLGILALGLIAAAALALAACASEPAGQSRSGSQGSGSTSSGPPPASADVPAATKGSSATGTTSESRSGAAVARTVNINSASREELNSLPDIGAERADRIIQNRPFTRTEELVERNIIPKNVYDQINDRLVAR